MQTILSVFFPSQQYKDYLLFKESFLIFKNLFFFSWDCSVFWLSSITIIFSLISFNFFISTSLGWLFSFLSSIYLPLVDSSIYNYTCDLFSSWFYLYFCDSAIFLLILSHVLTTHLIFCLMLSFPWVPPFLLCNYSSKWQLLACFLSFFSLISW